MKKDAFYFPHFCNARHDRKIKRVLKDLGIEGYGIFFMLLEVLREQVDFKYPLKDIDLLADEFGTSEPKIKAVIGAYDLFQVDEANNFFSMKQIFYLQPYIEKSDRARNAANKRWNLLNQPEIKPSFKEEGVGDNTDDANADANALHEQSVSNASKVKESKVKESKVKELPDLEISKTIEYCFLTMQRTITPEVVKELWRAFLIQNEQNSYLKEYDRITHFRNWIKTQPEKKDATPQKPADNKPKSIRDKYLSPVFRETITLQEWVQEYNNTNPDLSKIDLTYINQYFIKGEEKWKKAVMMEWFKKY
jgi:hypothetical protein